MGRGQEACWDGRARTQGACEACWEPQGLSRGMLEDEASQVYCHSCLAFSEEPNSDSQTLRAAQEDPLPWMC